MSNHCYCVTKHGAPLEHQHAAPGLGQVRRRDQAVDPGADDDRVPAHVARPASRARAARAPLAPMMPPPGCVPAPHCQ